MNKIVFMKKIVTSFLVIRRVMVRSHLLIALHFNKNEWFAQCDRAKET